MKSGGSDSRGSPCWRWQRRHRLPALTQTVSAASAVDRSCTGGERSGAGVAQKRFSMPAAGWVTARLSAAGGDWDVAIIDSADGRVVAGSASSGASEVASGLAVKGSDLIVQACRLSGGAPPRS